MTLYSLCNIFIMAHINIQISKIDVLSFYRELKYLIFIMSWCYIVHDIYHHLLFQVTQCYRFSLTM